MMNLLYTNQENKEEEKKQLSLSKSQLSQQSPLISILPTTNLELGISTTTYITTTIKIILKMSVFCVNYVLFYRATFSQKTE